MAGLDELGCAYGRGVSEKVNGTKGDIKSLCLKLDTLKEKQEEMGKSLDDLKVEFGKMNELLVKMQAKGDIKGQIFGWVVGGVIGILIGYLAKIF